MNTKSEPSLYRYVVSRRSTVAVSTLTPALYVLSTTLPDSTFFSFVRTNAGPLPGLTCWNSTMVHSWPSICRTSPFLKSAVDATVGSTPSLSRENRQFLGELGKQVGCRLAYDEGVLDADTAAIGQVDTGLHRHRGASKQCTGGGRADTRRFVDLQSDAVPEPVAEVLLVAGVDDDLSRCPVHTHQRHTGRGRLAAE